MNIRNPGSTEPTGVLILACSGAADVGAVADMAARRMARNGVGKMHCLAGVGGKVPTIMSNILSSSRILAIDGCDKNCAKETLIKVGFSLRFHLCLAELGMEKGTTTISVENIDKVASKATDMLES